MLRSTRTVCLALTIGWVALAAQAAPLGLEKLWTYESAIFDGSAAEIVAYDAGTARLFVTNADAKAIDVLQLAGANAGRKLFSIDVSGYTTSGESSPNSVAVHNGIVAVAVEDDANSQNTGSVVFFDADGSFQKEVAAGALPDMVTFTPDGTKVVVANEGEPNDNYDNDPVGSVTIIDLTNGVNAATPTTASFTPFNAQQAALELAGVRIFGPGATVAQDLEPEYIAVSNDSTTAYVTCQENNAVAIVNLAAGQVTKILALGTKDHSLVDSGFVGFTGAANSSNSLDASNKDNAIQITNWPAQGFFMPDAISAYQVGSQTHIVTANEGDARDYDGYSEEERVKDLLLDPTAFPNATGLQEDENLGRLNTTTANGDPDGDGDFDTIYSYGARSFSIWTVDGANTATLVFDSGDDFEQVLAATFPEQFNSTNDENDTFDNRSDDKGPEPEALTLGVVGNSVYAFIGLERMGGIMIYDITDPAAPKYVDYVLDRLFDGDAALGTAGDLGPEGLAFIPAADNPFGAPLLAVANEVSGTTTLYRITPEPASCALLGLGLLALVRNRRSKRLTR